MVSHPEGQPGHGGVRSQERAPNHPAISPIETRPHDFVVDMLRRAHHEPPRRQRRGGAAARCRSVTGLRPPPGSIRPSTSESGSAED
jgi:hypothetical protein